MKIGILHQYSLLSSGSGVYAARLAEGLMANDHTVHLFCRNLPDTRPDFVEAVILHTTAGTTSLLQTSPLEGGPRGVASPLEGGLRGGACTIHLLQGTVRPVAYPRTEAPQSPLFVELSDAQIEAFVNWQAARVAAVVQDAGLEILHANHVVLMPAVAARVKEATGIPYVVTVHGSTIEYVVNRDSRYLAYAQEGLSQAERVIVLNRDVRDRTLALCPRARVVEVPVGVDTTIFCPTLTLQNGEYNDYANISFNSSDASAGRPVVVRPAAVAPFRRVLPDRRLRRQTIAREGRPLPAGGRTHHPDPRPAGPAADGGG